MDTAAISMDPSPKTLNHKPEEIISLNGLSRRLDINYVRAGKLKPDFESGGAMYFRRNRIPAIRELVETPSPML